MNSQLIKKPGFSGLSPIQRGTSLVCLITLMLVVRAWVHTDLYRRSVINFGGGVVKETEVGGEGMDAY